MNSAHLQEAVPISGSHVITYLVMLLFRADRRILANPEDVAYAAGCCAVLAADPSAASLRYMPYGEADRLRNWCEEVRQNLRAAPPGSWLEAVGHSFAWPPCDRYPEIIRTLCGEGAVMTHTFLNRPAKPEGWGPMTFSAERLVESGGQLPDAARESIATAVREFGHLALEPFPDAAPAHFG